MKTTILFLMASAFLLLTSCGGKNKAGSGDGSDNAADNECVKQTSLSLFVDKKDLKDNKTFITSDSMFKINSQEFVFVNDSMAEIQFSGVSKLSSGAKSNVIVEISLQANNGKTLHSGIYKNMDFKSDYFAKVNINTGSGTIWFNRVSGMPETGAVNIHQINSNSVCGSIHLNVDKPDNNSIGVVKLNGNFYVEN